jgi:hypothetical protein
VKLPDIKLNMTARRQVSALNILLAFQNVPLMIWEQMEHEFLVIFGALKVLAKIETSGIFDYGFDEYVAEPLFHPRTADHLSEVQALYIIQSVTSAPKSNDTRSPPQPAPHSEANPKKNPYL